MAVKEMRRAYASSEVRELMEARRKAEHDEASRLAHAHSAGKLEGKLEDARQMLAAGISRETVLQVTGLRDSDLS